MIKYKKAGFWKENGYDVDSSLYDYKNSEESRKLSWFVSFYIRMSPTLFVSMGFTPCIITGKMIPAEAIKTDGEWIWSDHIIYYYEEHGVDLPVAFVEHIKRKIIPLPFIFIIKTCFNKEKLPKIANTIYDEFSEE